MTLINKLVKKTKEVGIKQIPSVIIRKIAGVDKLEERVKTLEFFLNAFHSPSDLPVASDPDLRILHLCDAELLHILDKFFTKHNITYWLDFGTLLGAVRHKGFIPWDDDMDIALPRTDYEKTITDLKAELESFGLTIYSNENGFGVGYRHHETGIWCDLFAVDSYKTNDSSNIAFGKVKSAINHLKSKGIDKDELSHETIIGSINSALLSDPDGKNTILYHMPEFKFPPYGTYAMYLSDIVYPLSKVTFETYQVNAPCNTDLYLREMYSNHYMEFPKSGVLHHGESSGRAPLSKWAKLHNVDMNEVLVKLKNIYSYI